MIYTDSVYNMMRTQEIFRSFDKRSSASHLIIKKSKKDVPADNQNSFEKALNNSLQTNNQSFVDNSYDMFVVNQALSNSNTLSKLNQHMATMAYVA